MDRRIFLSLCASSAIAGRACALNPSLQLTVEPDRPGNVIAEDFTGLSYETSQLHYPDFFAPTNTGLIAFVRRLGPRGILRIGGNTSARSVWRPDEKVIAAGADSLAANVLDDALGPDTGKKAAPHRTVTPPAIRNLRGFLDATGWSLIYGLNLGSEGPDVAAEEASYVAKTIGDKLVALQFGNEPDLFYRNGVRGPGYDFAQYAEEWQRYYEAVKKQVPGAVFAGPDTAHAGWLADFAHRFRNEASFLTEHYYAEGPPEDPRMTIDRLLRPNLELEKSFATLKALRQETGLTFRMAETNSCYQGGKQAVSNTFASALWGAELMFQVAAAGGTGINFHGGGYGWYTPIAGTPKHGFQARPLFYGMLLFAMAGPGRLIPATLSDNAPLVSVHAVRGVDRLVRAVVFNKNPERDLIIDVGADAASVVRLQAPSLDDLDHTTLGGTRVDNDASWTAPAGEKVAGTALVPRASAALFTFAWRA